MKIEVLHQSLAMGWDNPIEELNPRTIVLGSFNPFENKLKSVDFFYGRKSNHFWRTIAKIINQPEDYFFDIRYGSQRKIEIMRNRFCCLDVIDSIQFSSLNENSLDLFLKKEIYSNFKDQKIWAGYTDFQNSDRIFLTRKYNYKIIDLLNSNTSIRYVIHTMGESRIWEFGVKPKEANLYKQGFNGYFEEIKSICKRRGIQIVYDSYSPSDYAIKNGKTDKKKLENWLNEYLHLSLI